MRCPNCKKNTMRAWEGPVRVGDVEVIGRGHACSCGEVLFDAAEVERQEEMAVVAIATRGVRTGVEFKRVRKAVGLTGVELAELLDVRPETVSRWERGEVDVPRTVAFALGELLLRPKSTRERLGSLASAR